MRRLATCLMFVIWGCDQFSASVSDTGPAPPPPQPTASFSQEEPPPQAEPEPEPPPPFTPEPLPELPPSLAGGVTEGEIDGVHARVVDCYRSLFGISAVIVAVDRTPNGHEGVSTRMDIWTPDTGRREPSEVTVLDSVPKQHHRSLSMPCNDPIVLLLRWNTLPIGLQVVPEVTVRFSQTSATFTFKDLPVSDPLAQSLTTEARQHVVSRLESFLSRGSLGQGRWWFEETNGDVEVIINKYDIATGEIWGILRDPREATAVKDFVGNVVMADDGLGPAALDLETTKNSGIEAVPTPKPSTRNLLIKGQSVKLPLRLHYIETLGKTPRGVHISVQLPPA
jgi:hypothetical protein